MRCGRIALTIASLALTLPIQANIRFWDGGGTNNNWSNGSNWSSFFGVPANDGTDDIIMQGALRPTPLVDIDFDILSLQFSGGGNAGPFTISNSGGSDLSIRGGGIINNDTDLQIISRVALGASHTWNAASGTLQVNFVQLGGLTTGRALTVVGGFDTSIQETISGSALSNSGSIILNSTANFTLAGLASNTFTGPVTINGGTLVLNKTGGAIAVPGNLIIGDGSGSDVVKLLRNRQIANTSNVTINSSGLLNLNGFTDGFASLTMIGGTLTGGTLAVSSGITTNASANSARIILVSGGAAAFNVADGAATDDLIVSTNPISFAKNGAGQMRFSGTTFTAIQPIDVTVNGGTLLLATDSLTLGRLTVGDGVGGAGADVARLGVTQMFNAISSLEVNDSGLVDFDGHSQVVPSTILRGGQLTLGGAMLGVEHLSTEQSSATARVAGGTLLIDANQGSVPGFLTAADGPAAVDLEVTGALASNGGLLFSGGGAIVFSGAQSHAAGSLQFNSGTMTVNTDFGGGADPPVTSSAFVNFGTTQHLASLNITGGRTSLMTGGSNLLVTSVLTVDTTNARLDLAEHAAIVDYTGASPLASIRAYIVSARNGGAWNGFGITSSAAAAQPAHNTTLGVMEAADYLAIYGPGALFEGESIDFTAVLVKYTYYGDTDFNQIVNFDDYARTDNGFNNNLAGWIDGDFDLNGVVDFDDYALIDLAFNTQNGALARAMSYLDGRDRSNAGMSEPSLRMITEHFSQFGDAYALSFLNAVPEPGSFFTVCGLAASAASVRRRRSRGFALRR